MKFSIKQFVKISFFCQFGFNLYSAHVPSLLQQSAVAKRDILKVEVSQSYSYANKFFDTNRNQLTLGNSISQRHQTNFSMAYGLTDRFIFGFMFPYVIRDYSGNSSLDEFNHGLGDASFTFDVMLFRAHWIDIGVFYSRVFPSGQIDKFSIGKGVSASRYGVKTRFNLSEWGNFLLDGYYQGNNETIAEYLPVRIIDENGIEVVVGNQAVDFGDELHAKLNTEILVGGPVLLSLAAIFDYRFSTKVDNDKISYFSEDTSTTSSSGFLFSILPQVTVQLTNNVFVYVNSLLPVVGKRYPIVDLYMVEDLIGLINPSVGVKINFN